MTSKLSVGWQVNPDIIRELVSRGLPVLSETPPATTVEEMADLCRLVKVGAQLSVCHGYHGISLLRRLLGVGFKDATIRARMWTSAIVKSPELSLCTPPWPCTGTKAWL